jgi:hypothetical protein
LGTLSGFSGTVAIIYWMFYFPAAVLVPAFYGSYYWGTLGAYSLLALSLGLNFGVAVLLNQARKHQRDNAMDDRLSDKKMAKALDYWIKVHRKGTAE